MPGWREPQENDIVVFRGPENRNMLLVKRVIRIASRDGANPAIGFYWVKR
ncbi:hypothetical protein [Parabacteroides sp.]